MSKGLEFLKTMVEHNIEFSTKQIEKYLNMENPDIWVSSVSYFEGIKSSNESLLSCIKHEMELEEIELESAMELEEFLRNDGPPISMAERI